MAGAARAIKLIRSGACLLYPHASRAPMAAALPPVVLAGAKCPSPSSFHRAFVPALSQHWEWGSAAQRSSSPVGPSATLSSDACASARLACHGVRGLRSSSAVAAAADSALVDALRAEIAHEAEAYETPEDVAKGPPGPFKVEANPGASELVLRGSFQGEDIAVIASAPEEDDDDLLDGEEEEAGEAKEEEYVRPAPYLPVRVSITKTAADGTLQVLEIDAGLEESDWVVEGVSLKAPDVPDESIPYLGPDFTTLDPAVQDEFASFLERRGFTRQLASYLRSAFYHKDEQEYVSWLKRVTDFIAK